MNSYQMVLHRPVETASDFGKFVDALAHCVFDTVSAACAPAMGYRLIPLRDEAHLLKLPEETQ